MSTILLCILCFLWGRHVGKGKDILYIGSDRDRYDEALIGWLVRGRKD